MKYSFFALVACFALCCGTTVDAGVLGSAVGQIRLEDDDWEDQVFDSNSDGLLNDGDLLLGTFQIQASYNLLGSANTSDDLSVVDDLVAEASYSDATATFTGISLVKVNGDPTDVSGGVIYDYDFVGASTADWSTYAGIAGVDAGTGVILFDDPPASPHLDPTSVASGVTTASDGTEIARFSVVDWFARSVDTSGSNPLSLATTEDFVFYGALNTADSRFTAHNLLGDPDVGSTAMNAFFQTAGLVDLQLEGGLASGGSGFDITTDSNLYISTVPEPGSLAIFGLMGVSGVLARRRRRQQQA